MAMKSSWFKIKDILHLNGVFAHVLPCLPVHHPDSSFWKHQIFCTLRVVHFGNSSNHSNHHSPIIWVESRWIPGATWVVVGWLSPQLHSNVLHPKVALPISKAPGMNFVKGQRYTILLFQVPSCCLIFGVWGFGYLLLASSPRYPEIHQCPQLFGFGMAKSWDCVWIFGGLGIPTPASKKCWYSGVPLPNEKTHLQTCRFYLFPHHGSCWIIFRLFHLDATLKFECWNSYYSHLSECVFVVQWKCPQHPCICIGPACGFFLKWEIPQTFWSFFSGRFDGRKHQITSPFPWRHFWNVSRYCIITKGNWQFFVQHIPTQHANPWISCISDVPFLNCICGRFPKILEKEYPGVDEPKKHITSWWVQPIWKILVKMDHFPR